MYLYETEKEILIVDCGLGFADETMLGVDLLLPDISYLQKTNKKIAGMVITHGHEDHMGALPFVIPQLPSFPIFATPLTAAFANGKLKEFAIGTRVKTVSFDGGEIDLSDFKVSFIRVTHSVPDAANLFIKTPVGNFFHASDFKFDLTPYDGKRVDFAKIAKAAEQGILCLMSDSLGAEKEGHTLSEQVISQNIEREIRNCEGKFIFTTYSSNISRLNQAISASLKVGRKICFVGRSLTNAKEIAIDLSYMKFDKNMEISMDQVKNYQDKNLTLFVAGSQAQENSALTRIANDDHREIHLSPKDVVVFSADPIPGNEVSINALIDTISRKGARIVYSGISDDFHVSGHAASQDLLLMMSLINPKKVLPIGGTYRQMVAYKKLAKLKGIADSDIILIEDGQEVIFTKNRTTLGKKIQPKKVYVDQISGEEVDSFVLRDRQKISKEGVVIVMVEIDSGSGQLVEKPNIIARGLTVQENKLLNKNLAFEIKNFLSQKKVPVTDWMYIRKKIGDLAEKKIFKDLRKRPLVLPVVVEV